MTDSLLKAAESRFVRLLQADSIVPAPKKAHYIGSVKLGIAAARVASVILAVEGYTCAPQHRRAGCGSSAAHTPKTAEYAG
jgi:hypothetical protein